MFSARGKIRELKKRESRVVCESIDVSTGSLMTPQEKQIKQSKAVASTGDDSETQAKAQETRRRNRMHGPNAFTEANPFSFLSAHRVTFR